MEIKDFILAPTYLLAIFFLLYLIKRRSTNKKHLNKYLFPAVAVKLFGAFIFVIIYWYHYGYGDSISYYATARYLSNKLFEYPSDIIDILISPVSNFTVFQEYLISGSPSFAGYRNESNFMVVRVAVFLNLLSSNSYLITNFLFALLSFTGIWKTYITCYKLFPKNAKWYAIAIFFMPSVFFWGSPLLKDSLTISALGWLFYASTELMVFRNFRIIYVVEVLVAVLIISIIKIYVIAAFIPAFIFWLTVYKIAEIKNPFLRIFSVPSLLTIMILLSVLFINQVGEINAKYSIDNIGNAVRVTQEDIARNSSSEASYDLGVTDYSFTGLLKVFPSAVSTSLFRPYIWEVGNVVMLFSGIENTILLLLTIYTLFKVGLMRSLKTIMKNPFLQFCFVFSLIFAFAVGISTYNFGTLVRYKIPLILFYTIGLATLHGYTRPTSLDRNL